MGKTILQRVGHGILLATVVLLGLASRADALTAYGLTNTNGLIQFDTATPQNITFSIDQIGGLVANDDLIGIDFRPADGQLYAVGIPIREPSRLCCSAPAAPLLILPRWQTCI